MKKTRYEFLDHMKGVAVVLMILFHISFDMIHVGFLDMQLKNEFFWYVQPKIIITLFLLSVGISLCIVHKNKIRWNSFGKRSLKLAGLAAIVSLTTFYMFPLTWVYFGVLHNILFSSFFALPFLNSPKISLLLGLALVIPSAVFEYRYPFIELSYNPVDHVAFFPWFGIVLIGIYLYSIKTHLIPVPNYKFKEVINFLGRNSLIVYMTHQLILFPLVYLIYRIIHF